MEILIYIGKVSLYSTLLYSCYRLFLRQHTFFVWNRIYLIGSLVFSFALPFVIYPESAPAIPILYEVSSAPFGVTNSQEDRVSIFTLMNIIWTFYALGVLFTGFRLYKHIRQLVGFLNGGEQVELEECKIVLISSNQIGSFSFLKWIVVNHNDYENHFDAILRHETVHMQQGHTWDILLVEFIKIIFWFNPILILYKKSLQEVHEFLADAEAPNRDNYATFLVSYALNAPVASLTNHFFKPSQIKTRIQMIYKNRSSKWLMSSYAAAILLIGTTVLIVAGCERENLNDQNISSNSGSESNITIKGRILDSEKRGIPGANIVVAGKNVGTATDEKGNYTIQTSPNSTLEISGNGLQSLTVKVTNQTSIYAILAPAGQSKLKSYAYLSENTFQAPEKINNGPATEKVFTVVEEQPEFPGGTKAMFEFLGKNIRYPKPALDANVSGRVFLSFVVTETGEIEDIMVLKGIGFGCDSEAIRVLKSFPKWQPGRQSGVPVSVRYNLPINFQLEENDKKKTSAINIEKRPESLNRKLSAASFYPEINRAPDMTLGRDFAVGAQDENWGVKTVPLYVFDGKINDDPDYIKSIRTETIKSVSVLKGEAATKAYGSKGRNGVVEIQTK